MIQVGRSVQRTTRKQRGVFETGIWLSHAAGAGIDMYLAISALPLQNFSKGLPGSKKLGLGFSQQFCRERLYLQLAGFTCVMNSRGHRDS